MNRRRALSASAMSGGGGGININNYLTIVALEDGLTASFSKTACEYCVDGDGNWKILRTATNTEAINKGQTLSFRKEKSVDDLGTFTISKSCNLEGNCMSMLFGDDAASHVDLNEGNRYSPFENLFANCSTIRSVSKTFLPATTISESCYTAMFINCTNLITAPELPALQLESSCYDSMFKGCINLISAPVLPALQLKLDCYTAMFEGCTKLNYIKAMFTTTPSRTRTNNWVSGVASTGKFIKNKNATWNVTGAHGIPSGWSVQSAAQ